jgi:hypothetical protein
MPSITKGTAIPAHGNVLDTIAVMMDFDLVKRNHEMFHAQEAPAANGISPTRLPLIGKCLDREELVDIEPMGDVLDSEPGRHASSYHAPSILIRVPYLAGAGVQGPG